jgi:hypothetical protein
MRSQWQSWEREKGRIRGNSAAWRRPIRLLWVVLGALLLALASCRQRPLDGPAIDFSESSRKFGQLPEGQDVINHDFVFKNIGNEPLSIIKIVTQCSCLTTGVPKEPIPPGGSGTISARFKLASTTGPQTTSLLVFSDDPRQPVTKLSLTASVKVNIAVSTERLDLGWLDLGQGAGADFFVVVPWPAEQTQTDLVSFETSSPSLSVTVTSTEKKFNQWDGSIQVVNCKAAYSGTKVCGAVSEKIIVTCTDKPARKEILVSARSVGRIVAEPECVFFSNTEGSAPISKTVVINSTKGELPPIEKITCSSESVIAKSLESDARHCVVQIQIQPAKLEPGVIREEVLIHLKDAEQPLVSVRVLAYRR